MREDQSDWPARQRRRDTRLSYGLARDGGKSMRSIAKSSFTSPTQDLPVRLVGFPCRWQQKSGLYGVGRR